MGNRTALIIGLLILGAIAVPPLVQRTGSQPKAEAKDLAERTVSPVSAPAVTTPPDSVAAPVTLSMFHCIRSGMTYPECVSLLGSEGRAASVDPGGAESRTWENPGVMRIKITFRNGRVAGKGFENIAPKFRPIDVDEARRREQVAAGSPIITADAYQRLSVGMTYDQCVAIIGTPGEKAEMGAAGSGFSPQRQDNMVRNYVWRNPDTHAYVRFENGRLTRKVWYGR